MQHVSYSLMITLVALLMLQSQVANATFLCEKGQTALCVRNARPSDAKRHNIVRVEKSSDALAQVGTLAIKQNPGHYTCEKVNVAGFRPDTITRFCCKLLAAHKEGDLIGFTSHGLKEFNCQNHGGHHN